MLKPLTTYADVFYKIDVSEFNGCARLEISQHMPEAMVDGDVEKQHTQKILDHKISEGLWYGTGDFRGLVRMPVDERGKRGKRGFHWSHDIETAIAYSNFPRGITPIIYFNRYGEKVFTNFMNTKNNYYPPPLTRLIPDSDDFDVLCVGNLGETIKITTTSKSAPDPINHMMRTSYSIRYEMKSFEHLIWIRT